MKKAGLYTLLTFISFAAYSGTYTVTNTNNSGFGSLRAAMDSANASNQTSAINLMLTAKDTIHLLNYLTKMHVDLTVSGQPCQNPTISGDFIQFGCSAFFSQNNNLTLNNLNIINCLTTINGQGAAAFAYNLYLTNCYFYNNTVFVPGIGGACEGGATFSNQVTIAKNCTYAYNKVEGSGAQPSGGAASCVGTGSSFINCTFFANNGGDQGGAIEGITKYISNCTFAYNYARSGGAVASPYGFTEFSKNIFWGNTADYKPGLYYQRQPTSTGCNLFQKNGDDTLIVRLASDTFGVNPLLDTVLDYYGGCVPTLPIRCGSLAENFVSCTNTPVTDTAANGVVKQGKRDAGAFEVLPMTLSATSKPSSGTNGMATVAGTGGVKPYKYKWSNNQTKDTITGLAAGSYIVTVTDKTGCEMTTTVSVASINGIEAINEFITVEAYPNPANNEINLSVQTVRDGMISLVVTDMNGQPVLKVSEEQQGTWHKAIDTKQYAAGIYTLEVRTHESSIRRSLAVIH